MPRIETAALRLPELRNLQGQGGHPSRRNMKRMVRKPLLTTP
jgi:hypothetical protein